jgi:hypothetical protein
MNSRFKIGDVVNNISLNKSCAPTTGSFPWNGESKATIVSFHPDGTAWNDTHTLPNTYMIEYESTTKWGTQWGSWSRIRPAYEHQLKLMDMGL